MPGRAPAQHTDFVLAQFGSTPRTARLAYADFVRAGIRDPRGVDLEGGGLHRSLGGWERLVELRRGRERWSFDERILGGSSFVETALAYSEQTLRSSQRESVAALPELLDRVAAMCTTSPALVASRCKRPEAVRARALFSFAAAHGLGLPVGVVARHFGVPMQSVLRGLDAVGQFVEERRLTSSDLLPDRSRGRAPRGS